MSDGRDVDWGRAAWWTVGAVLAAALLLVVYSFVGTFVFGLFIYYATRPLYRRIQRHVRPPSLAAATSLVVLALPVLLLVVYTAAIGLQEFNKVRKRVEGLDSASVNLNGIWSQIEPYVNASSVARPPEQLLADPDLQLVREVALSALDYVGFIGTGLLHLFVMIAIAFYLLRDDHKLSRYVNRRLADDGGVLAAYARAVDRDLNSVFFGNILNALLTATIGAAAYNALNYFGPAGISVPYPTLVGLLAGAASLIPVVGMKLVYVPVSAFLAAEASLSSPELLWFPAVFFAVSFVFVDTIPDLVLRPYVSGRDLHVGMVMLAYIFGPLLFGWYGIFLGPLVLVLVVHFVRVVLPELVAGEPIRPWAVDPTYLLEGGESTASASSGGAGTDPTATETAPDTGDDQPPDTADSPDPAESPDAPDSPDPTPDGGRETDSTTE